MSSFIFAVNAVMPLILMVALGYILKRVGMIKPDFAKAANKLVFRIFLPTTLFLNVYKIESVGDINVGYVVYALAAVFIVFVVVAPLTKLITRDAKRRGVLLQASFRSNYALVGISLASALFGESGVAAAALLSAIIIPTYNVLAVISLSMFSFAGSEQSAKSGGTRSTEIKKMLLSIVKNPLIISTLLGLFCVLARGIFVEWDIAFRLSNVTVIYKVLEYLSQVSTPMALIILGAEFEFSKIGQMKREIISGALMRALVIPILGLGCAYVFFKNSFSPEQFAALVAMFATPVAVSTVPMVQEMGGDTSLAGQLVVWTTILSTLSLVGTCFFFKAVGVF